MNTILLLALASALAQTAAAQSAAAPPTPVIRSADLQTELAVLRQAYQDLHPGLYRYSGKREGISDVIAPRGVAVTCEASHFCMMMRGVERQHSSTVTSAMLGAFRHAKATRAEFLSLLSRGSADSR